MTKTGIKTGLSRFKRGKSAVRKATKSTRVTNTDFTRVNEAFREACDKAGIAPSSRQAGKFRRKTGLAWFSRML
jgi:hypothetical protein